MPPRPAITVVGSANVDMTIKTPRLPARGETVTDGTFLRAFGGKGANQAVAAARSGAEVHFVGCFGQDDEGALVLRTLQADGIDTSAVKRVADCATGVALIMADAAGVNYLSVAPGSNYRVTPEQVLAARPSFAKSRCVLLQMEVPVAANEAALQLAHELGIPVVFNYAPARIIEPALLRTVETLIVNETEASALTGLPVEQDVSAEVMRKLTGLGPRRVIVTLGGAGAKLWEGGVLHDVPAFPVTPVDTTAAGDTFCGAFAVAVSEGREALEAARFASAAAALTVTKLGAQCSIPHRAEIEQLL